MDYKKVENFAFWTVMVGVGVVLASYFLFDTKTYNDIFDIVSTVQVLAIIVQLLALYLSVKDAWLHPETIVVKEVE